MDRKDKSSLFSDLEEPMLVDAGDCNWLNWSRRIQNVHLRTARMEEIIIINVRAYLSWLKMEK